MRELWRRIATLLWRGRARDAWGWRWLDEALWDVRYALRVLLHRDRGFAVAAVVMLALAIGLNVIVFTVTDAMLFRGFPLVKQNDQLVCVQEVHPTGVRGISYADFEEWRTRVHSFRDVAAVMSGVHTAFSEGDRRTTDIVTWKVTANTFGMLGVPPILGRDFVPADELPGAAPVVLLNHRFWQSQFGRRADVVGSRVYVNGAPATIIGVMPERFDFPHQANFWMPVTRTPALERRGGAGGGYMAWGRLGRGATVRQARAELETINRRLQAAFPATNRGVRVSVRDSMHYHAGPDGPVVFGSLWVGACFVLLIACANVSNLTLVRTIGRCREFSTRMALGAGLWRMTRQILVEGLVLSCLAGTFAWWIAKSGVRAWASATASPFQIVDYTVDSGTFAYLAALSVTAAVLFSLGPICRVARQLGLRAGLRSDGRGVTQPLRIRRLTTILVAGQMALAVVLLAGAGVLVRSLMNIVDAPTGVRDPDHVLVGLVRLPSDKYPTPDARLAYFERLNARLTGIPGIERASASTSVPVRGGRTEIFEIEGRSTPPEGLPIAQFLAVGPDYFRLLGASVTAGRDVAGGDRMTTPQVAIVNQAFVERFWPGEASIGQRVRVVEHGHASEWRTVVGIASNVMEGDPVRQHFPPVIYLPIGQAPPPAAYFLARTRVPPDTAARAVRAAVEGLDPDVTLRDFATLKDVFAFDGDYTDLQHMELGKDASVSPIFALVALLLAGIGLYAVIAHSVSQRTQEIGVRIAIGARAGDIRRLVFGEGMVPVACGIALGLASSLAVNRILQSQLVGISPYDPATVGSALAVLAAVALLACHVPARRATRVDPIVALRHE